MFSPRSYKPFTSRTFHTVVTDTFEDGEPAYTFEPWTDGHAVGFKVTRHIDREIEEQLLEL